MPVVLILLLGMLEFGFAFSHHLTLEYATREGARMGAALANGTAEVACGPTTATSDLDAYVIALGRAGIAVRRLEQRASSLESLFLQLTAESRPAGSDVDAAAAAGTRELS